ALSMDTQSRSLAVLLDKSCSPRGGLMNAWLINIGGEPVRVPVALKTTLLPTGSVTTAAMSPAPDGGHVAPGLAVHVQFPPVRSGGKESVTTPPVALVS